MAEFLGRTHELDVIHASVARARRERRPTAVVVDGEHLRGYRPRQCSLFAWRDTELPI